MMSNLRNCSAFILKQSVSNILCTMGAMETNSGPNLTVRTFSRTRHLAKSKNFYEDLEIPKTATQSEIKAAYYDLSMAYHPDKNKSEQAKIKFRLISEAYEVLGNVRTRRMYDKGIGSFSDHSTAAPRQSDESEILYEETEDDAVTKFYKQHMVKSKPPSNVSAQNVDTYMAEAITKSFYQMQRRKKVRREKDEDVRLYEQNYYGYIFFMLIIFIVIFIVGIPQMAYNKKHDAELRRIKLENENKSAVK